MAVTKEVWGKNTSVGAKKADMIAQMRAQGYMLVNEIAEPYYFEGVIAGIGAGAGTKYTLTFQYSEELHKQIQKEEEERKKREAEEAAKRAEEAAKRAEQARQVRLAQENEEKALRDPLGYGYGLLVTVNTEDKQEIKTAIKAIQNILSKPPIGEGICEKLHLEAFKKDKIILKSYGKYFPLIDFGKGTCELFAKMLRKMGVQTEIVMLSEGKPLEKYVQEMFVFLRRKFKKLRRDVDVKGIFNRVIGDAIFVTAYERIVRTRKDFTLHSYQYIISNQ